MHITGFLIDIIHNMGFLQPAVIHRLGFYDTWGFYGIQKKYYEWFLKGKQRTLTPIGDFYEVIENYNTTDGFPRSNREHRFH